MTTTRIYLDHNATAPVTGPVRDAVMRALDLAANASSVHGEGRAARRVIEEARARVAELTGATEEDVIFTSGGTEANALAIASAVASGQVGRLAVSATEHPSVLEAARHAGVPCEIVPVDREGTIDLAALERILQADRVPALVCVMHANNETGVIQPVSRVAEIVRAHGSLLHVDAVQTVGRMPVSIGTIGADTLSLSAHKIGGPQGAGALVTRPALPVSPMIRGGGQERGRRSGTENLPGIAGFAAAAARAQAARSDVAGIEALRDRLESGLLAEEPDVIVFSRGAPRLANTCCFALPGARAETLVIAFDLAGIAVSSGSACSSGKVGHSHVLAAMGVSRDMVDGAVRVSMGAQTTEQDVEGFLATWRGIVARHRTKRSVAA